MNKFVKILLFILVSPFVLQAQQELVPVSYDTLKLEDETILKENIDPNIKNEYLHAKYWRTSDEYELFVEIFYIAGNDTLHYLQETFDDTWYSIELEDVNFDQYLDIKYLISVAGNSSNVSYEYLPYNSETKQFEYEEYVFTNPKFNHETKTLTSGGTMGCMGRCWSITTSKFIDGKLTPIKYEEQDGVGSGWSQIRHVVKKRINGALKVVTDTTIAAENSRLFRKAYH